MNSLNVLERAPSVLSSLPILAENGFTCTLLTLEAGAESVLPASRSADDALLFVVEGDIAVHAEGITTIVNRGGAFVLGAGKSPAVTARAGSPARLLHVEIPPREVIVPQIITPRA